MPGTVQRNAVWPAPGAAVVTSVPVVSVIGASPSAYLNAAVASAPPVWILIWIACVSGGGVLVPGCVAAPPPPPAPPPAPADPPALVGVGVGVGEGEGVDVLELPPPVCTPKWKSILSCS